MARDGFRTGRDLLPFPFVLALAACGPGSPAGEEDAPVDSASQGIVGGDVDTEHRSVFALFARVGDLISSCTATLIAPNVLLTARHCVSASDDAPVVCGKAALGRLYAPENLRASNPVSLYDDARWFRGAEIHVPSEGDDTCGFDVALVRLSENVPLSMAEPAVPRIDRAVQKGEPYVAVGYGVSDNENDRARMARDGLYVSCSPGTCGRHAVVTEFVGDTGVCSGDSGGPAFDADGKLVGIVSRGADDCDLPIYGAVNAWRDLIVRVTADSAVLGGYEPPFWVKTGASDPPVLEPDPTCEEGESCPPDDGSEPMPGVDDASVSPSATCAHRPGPLPDGSGLALFGVASLFLIGARRRRARCAARAT